MSVTSSVEARLNERAHQRNFCEQLTGRQRVVESDAVRGAGEARERQRGSGTREAARRTVAETSRRSVFGKPATAAGTGALQEGDLRSASGSFEHEPAGADASGVRRGLGTKAPQLGRSPRSGSGTRGAAGEAPPGAAWPGPRRQSSRAQRKPSGEHARAR